MRFVDLCVLIRIHNKCIKINCRVRNNLHKVPKKQIYKSCIIYKNVHIYRNNAGGAVGLADRKTGGNEGCDMQKNMNIMQNGAKKTSPAPP